YRNSVEVDFEGGGHHRVGPRCDRRRVLRRLGGDSCGGTNRREDGHARAGYRGSVGAGDRTGGGRQSPLRYLPCGPATRGRGRLFGGDRVRWTWNRSAVARRAAGTELWQAGTGSPLATRHGVGHRTDGQHGEGSGPGVGRPLDGGHGRWELVGSLRTHDCDSIQRSGARLEPVVRMSQTTIDKEKG